MYSDGLSFIFEYMRKLLFLLTIGLVSYSFGYSQDQNAQQLQATARNMMRLGDFNNAVATLNKSLAIDPYNLEAQKDLAYTLYLKKDYATALMTAKPLSEQANADVQCIQILALIYNSLEEKKSLEKLYKNGLKKFPKSGSLYYEYGKFLWDKKEQHNALMQWEKGIQQDANYPGNYFELAQYYLKGDEKLWGLLYGELFVNLESYSERTVLMQDLLFAGYKKMFYAVDIFEKQNTSNPFEKLCLTLLDKHRNILTNGITSENITALKARFILDWNQLGAKFPYRLFDHYTQLIRAGLLEAYTEWSLGGGESMTKYQEWVRTHQEDHYEWMRLQQNRVFKIPAGQYYK